MKMDERTTNLDELCRRPYYRLVAFLNRFSGL